MKKKININGIIVLFILLILVALSTYLIPSGEYARIEVNGRTMVDASSFKIVESNPTSFLNFFKSIPLGLQEASMLIIMIFLIGGAIRVFESTGAIRAFIYLLRDKIGDKNSYLILILISIFFGCLGTFPGMLEAVIPFAPLCISIAITLGYDALVGISMCLIPITIGWSAGVTNPWTTGIGQSLAELPMFSGFEYRFFVFVIFLLISIIYTLIYAKKIKNNPEKSLIHSKDLKHLEIEKENIKKDLGDFGLEYDVFFSEKSLYENGLVDKALESLREQGFVYEKDGALWLETTALGTGDDKDRVLIKADSSLTYLTSDIAYHKNKLDRGFDLLIDVLGADHHGYIARLKASIVAMGYKAEQLEVLIMQMVQLLNNGEVVKMSKRTGKAITLRDLIDEVGADAARYFLVMRSADSHLDFDFAVAKEQSSDNPLYYVQYAHARICSILRQAEEQAEYDVKNCDYELLTDEYSVDLLKNLAYYPEVVAQAAKNYEPHRICNYLQSLASSFHKFYNNNKVITENKEQTQSYLALITAVKITLRNALDLIGVSAPEKM